MREISSRFSNESGSKEMIISEREYKYSFTHDVHQHTKLKNHYNVNKNNNNLFISFINIR